ncbi:MAG TPA: ATP-binding protein [Candidatus Binatia bacterium]|nr:ATP-binding protein [Candidatus Binatia bacterium]
MKHEIPSGPVGSLSSRSSGELPWDIVLPWVVRLRFTISVAQVLIALAVQFLLQIDLPLGWIFVIAALTTASNIALRSRVSRPPEKWELHPSKLIALLFFSDTVALTILLMLTGGATNPFTVLYLVYMTLSAAILKPTQTWAIGAFSTLCFGILFFFYRPISQLEMAHHGSGANLHLIGMWIGFLITVFLVATFAGAMSNLLRIWQASLIEMQKNLAKKDRLASLATLAAGAAHELNTPLGTIALLSKELEHQAENSASHAEFADDCRVIRHEVDRCRQILLKLTGPGSETGVRERTTLSGLISDIRGFSEGLDHPLEIAVLQSVDLRSTTIAREPILQSVTALLKNAADASPGNLPIHLSIRVAGDRLQFCIEDHGTGMTEETLRRIGEPFFTTKEPGKGMGLGTFLAIAFAEQLGGRLTYTSDLGKGTRAVFEIPVHQEVERILGA